MPKAAKWSLRIIVFLTFLLCALEVVYRYQWIDTYAGALKGLNPEGELEKDERTVLVFGDSFSAFPESWVKQIREHFPDYRVVNSAVAGTGIVQADIMARRRFRQFKPDILIYQIYVGNDLLDYRYPVNWSKIGPLRNIYWWWSQRFRSIGYLNYAFGQMGSGPNTEELIKVYQRPFSLEDYNQREKLLLQAEPDLIENQVFLEGGREKDMEGYLDRMDNLLEICEANGTTAYLLVLPHCAQVNPTYKKNMEALGAGFRKAWHTRADYPFVNRLAGHVQGRAIVLNPLADLQSASKAGDPLYFSNDPHLTPAGQKWLGNWVQNALRQTNVTE